MQSLPEPYYKLYESRYRRVYEQGIDYWTNLPEEVQDHLEQLRAFLKFAGLKPDRHRILEAGCGEGHLARELVALGFDYTGIDISPAALEKASKRLKEAGLSGNLVLGDITQLTRSFGDNSFDAAIDNMCLHMLVVDSDRQAYLTGLMRVLKPGSLAYFNENCQDEEYDGKIATFEEYLRAFQPDLATEEERDAYSGGQYVKIRLPRVPARPRSYEGYKQEFIEAGFTIEHFQRSQAGYTCQIYVRTGGR